MIDEGRVMKDGGRGTRDEKALGLASIVVESKASGCPSSVVFFLLSLLLLLTSCGYRFTSVGGLVPEDTKTIAIPAFINGTAEPYVDVEVTKAVVNEFLTDGRLKVVGAETADLVLKGRVTKFEMTPSSYTVDNYVQSYTVSLGLNVTVEDERTHKLIWQDSGIGSVFNTSYGVSMVTNNGVSTVDITATKIAKETALKNACKDVASTLRSKLLEGF
jgi:hypothetical protein